MLISNELIRRTSLPQVVLDFPKKILSRQSVDPTETEFLRSEVLLRSGDARASKTSRQIAQPSIAVRLLSGIFLWVGLAWDIFLWRCCARESLNQMTNYPSFDPHRRFFAHARGCERMIGIRGFAITRGVVNAAVYQLISNLGKPVAI